MVPRIGKIARISEWTRATPMASIIMPVISSLLTVNMHTRLEVMFIKHF